MLPELQQRYDSLYDALAEQFEALADMGQVDYDRAVNEWLPATLRQIEEVQQACESDLQHYARMRRETVTRIDKAWARLTRLDPVAQPGPDESVESLANDLDIWRNEVERHAENPAALRDLLGRRAGTLEQRIEGIYHQIVEGRRNLDALDKQYRRVLQSGRNLRNRVREMQRDNPWKGIGWDTDPVDAIWERTIALERESQEAPTLMQAGNLLQQAIAQCGPGGRGRLFETARPDRQLAASPGGGSAGYRIIPGAGASARRPAQSTGPDRGAGRAGRVLCRRTPYPYPGPERNDGGGGPSPVTPGPRSAEQHVN